MASTVVSTFSCGNILWPAASDTAICASAATTSIGYILMGLNIHMSYLIVSPAMCTGPSTRSTTAVASDRHCQWHCNTDCLWHSQQPYMPLACPRLEVTTAWQWLLEGPRQQQKSLGSCMSTSVLDSYGFIGCGVSSGECHAT